MSCGYRSYSKIALKSTSYPLYFILNFSSTTSKPSRPFEMFFCVPLTDRTIILKNKNLPPESTSLVYATILPREILLW